ncbi:hypothetical protein CNR27_12180 [Luteimonas chenhongjianii]|uniref:Aerotolerance regulator N-terminal domain-containing protein n=1 Tax=Luteimonas chenhongjianii TaxID=2006110 RepID=A0A290XGP5_9GAMM|nr:BatA domain-containing protein [Luteimonas chenhongjianii]ATD68096.1 hypothetical protein CNR27_12180 [Luteimonas chenhongjianii]
MSVGLLAPVALAALAAWLLPLLLHLARRDATRPTPFAALRWLREKPRPRRRLRFDDWPLLLMRLLLLALLALWLAWPVLHGARPPAHWTVVVPGVVEDAIPVVADGDAPPRWLAPGFPPIEGPNAPEPEPASVSSLLRELDMTLPAGTTLTVVAPEVIDRADGGTVALSRVVDWRTVPSHADAAEPQASEAPPLDVLAIAGDDPSLRVLRAVARAWRPDDADALATPATGAALRTGALAAWWGEGTPASGVLAHAAGGVLLLGPATPRDPGADWQPAWRDADGGILAERAPCAAATCIRFTRALDPAHLPAVLDPAFPARLRALARPLPAPARITADEFAPTTGLAAYPPTPRDLRPWLALLIALAFALERWMAASPRRNRTA